MGPRWPISFNGSIAGGLRCPKTVRSEYCRIGSMTSWPRARISTRRYEVANSCRGGRSDLAVVPLPPLRSVGMDARRLPRAPSTRPFCPLAERAARGLAFGVTMGTQDRRYEGGQRYTSREEGIARAIEIRDTMAPCPAFIPSPGGICANCGKLWEHERHRRQHRRAVRYGQALEGGSP